MGSQINRKISKIGESTEASTSSEIDGIVSITEFYNGRSIFITGGTGEFHVMIIILFY